MTRDYITLADDKFRQKAVEKIMSAPDGTRLEFRSPKRSTDQNALLWARLSAIAKQLEWYGRYLSAEDWKDVLSASLRKTRVVPGIDEGTFVPLGMRTSQMTKQEFSDLLELIAAFGAERGVTFPEDAPKAWRRDDEADA